MEMINGLLPEIIRMRDQLNGVIMEMDYYRTLHSEAGHTKIAKIVMAACTAHFGVTQSGIESKSRDTDIRMARQIFMVLTYKLTSLSLAKVGAMVGKDHATVSHAQKVVDNSSDPAHDHYKDIEKQVQRALTNVEGEKTIQRKL